MRTTNSSSTALWERLSDAIPVCGPLRLSSSEWSISSTREIELVIPVMLGDYSPAILPVPPDRSSNHGQSFTSFSSKKGTTRSFRRSAAGESASLPIIRVWQTSLSNRCPMNGLVGRPAAPDPFHVPNIERRPARRVASRAFALSNLRVSLLFCLGFLKAMTCASVRHQAFLRNLGFQRLSLIVSRSCAARRPRTPAGEIEWPSFLISLGDADLAEGRLLQRKFNDPLRDLGRGPVRPRSASSRLISCNASSPPLLIEILEAVEAIAL